MTVSDPPQPPERPEDEVGVTGPEARAGEPVADRLEREEPDIGAEERYDTSESGRPAGRLVEPDEVARITG